MIPYFITGFPRTRTAWLANFLTYDDSFCFHEALKRCDGVDALPELFKSTGRRYVGNSDSALPFFAETVRKLFPQAKWVIVDRNEDEVLKSVRRVLPGLKHQEMLNMTKNFLDSLGGALRIKFLELKNKDKCEEIWKYCIPDIAFSNMRWKLLDQLNVQANDLNGGIKWQ